MHPALALAATATAVAASLYPRAVRADLPWPWLVFIVCLVLAAVVVGIVIGILRGYRNR